MQDLYRPPYNATSCKTKEIPFKSNLLIVVLNIKRDFACFCSRVLVKVHLF